jgi:hypothetical protein
MSQLFELLETALNSPTKDDRLECLRACATNCIVIWIDDDKPQEKTRRALGRREKRCPER